MDDQQGLFQGLLGDPVRAKMAKDANAILKGVGKVPPPALPVRHGSTVCRLAPYLGRAQIQCFRWTYHWRVLCPVVLLDDGSFSAEFTINLWFRIGLFYLGSSSFDRSFAQCGHMVRNKLCWDTNDAVGLPKQRNSYQSSPTSFVLKVPHHVTGSCKGPITRFLPWSREAQFRS